MRRREFAGILAIPMLARSLGVRAQGSAPRRMAIVHSGIPADKLTETGGVTWLHEFFGELRRLGYVEGGNLIVERYSAEGHIDRAAELARSVVARNPTVIVTNGPLVLPFGAATTTIPILAVMAEPISEGVSDSLARPSANITGVAVDAGIELYGKRLEILKEALPGASRVAYLGSHTQFDGVFGKAARDAGRRLGLEVVGAPLGEVTQPELERAFQRMVQERLDAVTVSAAGEYLANRLPIAALAASSRLPAMYPYRDYVDGGGLMAYAPDLPELARHLAGQVRRVLDGARPQEIPIYQATTFHLIVNQKAATALGLALPPALLARADEVID